MRKEEHEAFAAQRYHELIEKAASLRNESHLSQKQVADILGFRSNGNIPLIETEKSMPGLDKFLKILSVYGYTLDIVPKPEGESRS